MEKYSNFLNNFTYLFLALLGLRCSGDFSLVAASRSYSLVAVGGLFTAVAFLVEHRLEGTQDLVESHRL